jgi:hypothetical protein
MKWIHVFIFKCYKRNESLASKRPLSCRNGCICASDRLNASPFARAGRFVSVHTCHRLNIRRSAYLGMGWPQSVRRGGGAFRLVAGVLVRPMRRGRCGLANPRRAHPAPSWSAWLPLRHQLLAIRCTVHILMCTCVEYCILWAMHSCWKVVTRNEKLKKKMQRLRDRVCADIQGSIRARVSVSETTKCLEDRRV